jgi:2-keto-4-pentenoate hydratase/2-oxohepta-3-ene-1,7-dioic acid hydratase in catechol pathway
VELLLRSFDPADGVPSPGTVLAPLRSPRKLICAGAKYVDHLREMGIPQLPSGLEPYFFLLPPTSIAGPDDVVVIPTDPGARVDWEAELAVVIGTPGAASARTRTARSTAGGTSDARGSVDLREMGRNHVLDGSTTSRANAPLGRV